MKKIFVMFFMLFVLVMLLFSQESQNVSLVGKLPMGPSFAVAVSGNYAFVGNGPKMLVLDISQPSNPVYVSEIVFNSTVWDIKISGDYAYVADNKEGLRIVDISQPSNPVEVGFYDNSDEAVGVFVSGNYVYLADFSEGLKIIDISNVSAPQEVGIYNTEYLERIQVSGNIAFLSAFLGITILDISNPSQPVEVSLYNPGNIQSTAFKVSGNYLYYNNMSRLKVIDISQIDNPTEVGISDSIGVAHSINIYQNYAYVTEYCGNISVVDISNVSSPVNIGSYHTDTNFNNSVNIGSTLYIASLKDGLKIIDAENPSNLIEVGNYEVQDFFKDVYVYNGYAFLIGSAKTVRIIDVHNPESPTVIGTFSTQYGIMNAYVYQDNLYLVDYDYNIHFIDISDINSPSEVGCFEVEMYASEVLFKNHYAFINASPLKIYDINNYDNIVELSQIPLDNFQKFIVFGNYLYLYSIYTSEFKIYDISNISSPQLVSTYNVNFENNIRGITATDNAVFILDNNFIIHNFDVSDIYSPTEVATFDTEQNLNDIYVYQIYAKDNFLYIGDSGIGFRVINVNDLTNPFEGGYYELPFEGLKICNNGDNFYVVDSFDGLYILQNNLLGVDFDNLIVNKNGMLYQNYPNPFNPTTKIKFSLQSPNDVDLSIYNLKGQKISTLVSGFKDRGNYSVVWNGKDQYGKNVSSGIYLYKLKLNGKIQKIRKCMIVK